MQTTDTGLVISVDKTDHMKLFLEEDHRHLFAQDELKHMFSKWGADSGSTVCTEHPSISSTQMWTDQLSEILHKHFQSSLQLL